MFNFSIACLTFLLLVSQNVLLLNEETLILFCFVIFCWIAFNQLSTSINDDFLNRSMKIEESFVNSLNQVEKSLTNNANLQSKFKTLALDFTILKNHFTTLNEAVSNKLTVYSIQNSQATYSKKLLFTHRLEQQTAKLMVLLLSKKLNKVIFLKQFYTKSLKVPSFLCFYKINLREYFETI